ncbi:hypothetical protein AD945_03080 [Gluconobacter albidus]|uniref:DotM C-terminal cytoplasmic domain-containing protein n=1 Tax=Gluconobacter albidus TaxID=318683 RepID=A0A149TM41_9PROT|nr:hypothetical protein [Gluconobacter albidus]KXV49940.1 hypothetical protein AD945_03080 [Gluconobacter albidus]
MSGSTTRASAPRSAGEQSLILSGIALVGAGVLGWMVWTTFHTQISRFYCHALIWQIGIMPATPELAHLNVQLHQALYHPSSIRLVQLYYGLSIVGLQLRWPALLVGGICVGLCLFFGENKQLRTVLDLEGLIEVQARMFPTLRGFARRRLTSLVAPAADAPLPADPALTVEEWRARFATAEDGSLSEVCAAEAFEQQLGPHYTTAGPRAAPPIAQVLFSAFALHKLKRRDEAMVQLGRLSESLADSGLDGETGPLRSLDVPQDVVNAAQVSLAEPDVQATISESCDGHGWTTTALMTLLCDARFRAGVLAPPAFAIVKLIDRPLWYALHSLGYPSENPNEDVHPNPRIEAAGARAHWAEEQRLRRPLYIPVLDRALATLRSA